MTTVRYLTGPEVREQLAIASAQLQQFTRRKIDPIPHLRVGQAYRIPIDLLAAWETRNTAGLQD